MRFRNSISHHHKIRHSIKEMLKSVGSFGVRRCLKTTELKKLASSSVLEPWSSGLAGTLTTSPSCASTATTNRKISTSFPPLYSYEGDGKTTLTILNHEYDSPLMVDSYHHNGFTLNNGFGVFGPLALFPKTALGWDVKRGEFITPETLALFGILEPKLDILIIGKGDTKDQVPAETIQYLRKKKISFEILTTEHACTTFNFLNAERRCVAAALIPPKQIAFTEEDTLRIKFDKQRLYDDKNYKD